MEEIDFYLDAAKETMDGAMKHLLIELNKIRAGRASASMLDGLQVDYYGMMTPLTGAASISTPDARSLAIKPFERKMIGEIEKAIRNSNLGFSPSNDGETIRINIPMLTEDRRRELMKRVKNEIETAKINIRNIRQDANGSIRKLKNDGVSEDDVKRGEERCQKMTDAFVSKVDATFAEKEKDIMSV